MKRGVSDILAVADRHERAYMRMSETRSLGTQDNINEEDPGCYKIEESGPSGSRSHSDGVFEDGAGGDTTLSKDDAALEEDQTNSSPGILASRELVEGSDTLSEVLQEVVPPEDLVEHEGTECVQEESTSVGGSASHPLK